MRIVVDTKLRTPDSANVLTGNSPGSTLIVTSDNVDASRVVSLEKAGAEIIKVPEQDGRVDLQAMLVKLGERNIQSILLEGGAILAGEALRSRIVDRVAVFIAPKLLGGDDGVGLFSGPGCGRLSDAIQLKDIRVQKFADDIMIEGEVA